VSKQKADPASAPRADHDVELRDHASQPFLRMRPKHFFSNQFELEIVENYSADDGDRRARKQPNWLNRFIDVNLVLMILVIGVPILLYCIVASAK
jgi:lipopolysaccharide/colanic/teichoic acid biosynthesis glycosyltransferase